MEQREATAGSQTEARSESAVGVAPRRRSAPRPAFSLRGLLLAVLRRLLYTTVRTRVTPDSPDELAIDPDQPVCYVLQDRHLSSLLVLEEEARRLGLPSALGPPGPELPAEKRSLFSVILNRNPLSSRTAEPSAALGRLVSEVMARPSLDVQLVAVSILWGRSPGSQDSLLKALLADAWATVGPLRQLLIILRHGGQTLVSFAQPVSLRKLIDDENDPALALRKSNRFLRFHFRRVREAAIGPDLSHRRNLIEAMIRSESLDRAIAEEAQRRGIDRAAAEQRARRFAWEIASDFSYPVVRALELFLRRLWERLFDAVEVHHAEEITRAVPGKGVVYLPNHRSHLDYLLLGYFINHEGLAPPHIAAGANLNFPLVGPVLRRGGAFFLRRSFKGEPLYAAVFREYLHTMVARGFPIAYFIEGGRSRSGRTLSPKGGLLGITVESYLREHPRPLLLVPVYIGYQKLLEGRTFVAELEGAPKERESVGALLGVVRRLRRIYGRAYLNFGAALALAPWLDEHAPGWRETEGDERLVLAKSLTPAISREIGERINRAVVINPVNLFAMAILASPRNALDERVLVRQLGLLRSLAERIPYSPDAVLTPVSAEETVAEALRLGYATRIAHPLGDVIKVPDDQVSTLTYLRNNVLHAFALPALVSGLIAGSRELGREAMAELVADMQPFLRAELMLHHTAEQAAAEVLRTVDVLHETGLVRSAADGAIRATEPYSGERFHLELLGRSLRPLLRRHYLTIALLTRFGPGQLTSARLESIVSMLSQRLSLLFEFATPDFYEPAAFATYVDALIDNGVVRLDDQGRLDFDKRVRDAARSVERLLPPDAIQAIRRITVDRPVEKAPG